VGAAVYNPQAPDVWATAGEQTPGTAPDVVVDGEVVTGASRTDAEAYALARRQELEGQTVALEASGNHALRPADRIALGAGGAEYLVRAVRHAAQNAVYGRQAFCTARVEGQPLALRYRPPRTTGRPRVGPLPAVVVDGAGRPRPRGVAHPRPGTTDEVFVRLPFAREPVAARVATFWSGTRWLPCLGDHVRVDIDGDRPMVTHDLPGRAPRAGRHRLTPGSRRISSPEDLLLEVARALRFDVRGDTLAELLGKLVLTVGKECVFEVKEKLTFRCGGSTIVLSPEGVAINGSTLYLNSPGGPQPSAATPQ
jgi:hypothetical protein